MTSFFLMTTVVVCLIGLSKGGLGGTLGVLATPLMALVLPADQVIGLLLPILMIADIFAVASHWQRWDTKLVWLLTPGAILGMGVGTLFIASISAVTLKRGIGVIVLLFVIYRLFESRLVNMSQYHPRSWHGLLAGGAAGFSSTLAHTGGPPVAIYLLMQNVSPRTFVATSALFFTIVNWIKVPSYLYIGLFDFRLLGQVVWLLPLLPVSVWVGKQMADKIDKVLFNRMIIILLVVSALFLLLG
jgi:uncharacterized membrane protein YfcA